MEKKKRKVERQKEKNKQTKGKKEIEKGIGIRELETQNKEPGNTKHGTTGNTVAQSISALDSCYEKWGRFETLKKKLGTLSGHYYSKRKRQPGLFSF